ncbi:MAG: SpoIIE family protein phosphatase, partial [Oscillospiraceae bacterium]|nr:SpoIIE family protein phosphatase [Oscillospiraceae bacterium]
TLRDRGARQHLILSDGMGSGGKAAVDSTMATGLIAKLLSVGISHEAALKMVNSALLIKSGEESLATIDVCTIDLFTGKAGFYKAGAAPTYILRAGKAGLVESSSLPAGILHGVAFEKSSLTLGAGDLIMMVSDGVTATGSDWILSEMKSIGAQDVQNLCESIANTAAIRRQDKHSDDITVLAARLDS